MRKEQKIVKQKIESGKYHPGTRMELKFGIRKLTDKEKESFKKK